VLEDALDDVGLVAAVNERDDLHLPAALGTAETA